MHSSQFNEKEKGKKEEEGKVYIQTGMGLVEEWSGVIYVRLGLENLSLLGSLGTRIVCIGMWYC